jgi:hypothetical protein
MPPPTRDEMVWQRALAASGALVGVFLEPDRTASLRSLTEKLNKDGVDHHVIAFTIAESLYPILAAADARIAGGA